MVDSFENEFSLKSEKIYLNHSQTKAIQLYVKTVFPEFKVSFKLFALNHNCYVEFSKDVYYKILDNADKIKVILQSQEEETIIENNELVVFTEKMHGKCAVCFQNANNGIRVNVLIETFRKLITKSGKIEECYSKIFQNVNSTAKKYRDFIDGIILKAKDCKITNFEFNDYLLQKRQHLSMLCHTQDECKVVHDFEADSEDESEDDYYGRRGY